jgi:hypothetical protein
VFSTDTEEEARSLITLCCPTDSAGTYFARELAAKQTLPNLQKFSDRLAAGWAVMQKNRKTKR